MGLDMYLTGEIYIWSGEKNDPTRAKIQEIFNTGLKPKRVEFEIMYWRKANAIHKWFVDNVQDGKDDCERYCVSTDQLMELLNAVRRAIKSTNPEEHLPTQSGFFFGGTEYDEWYDKSLKHTQETLEKFLTSEESKTLDLYYHSSW